MPDRTVMAYFEDRRQAERAVDELKLAGFEPQEISLGSQGHGFLDAILPRTDRDDPTRVAVTSSRQLEAASILQRLGGRDEDAHQRSSDSANGRQDSRVIELLEEEPVPTLVPTQVGEIRITKVVQTETRVLEVPVRREELVVERVPVRQGTRGSSAAAAEVGDYEEAQQFEGANAAGAEPGDERRAERDGPNEVPSLMGADEEVIRVPLLEERVVITLEPFVREEVLVRKRRVSEPYSESVEIRREELQVESSGEAEVQEVQAGTNGRGDVA